MENSPNKIKILFLMANCYKFAEYKNGEYTFLRNCGHWGYISKYTYPNISDELHLGNKIKAYGNKKYKNFKIYWEGGPDVGIKALIYNLSLRDNFYIEISDKIIEGFDFYYFHNTLPNLNELTINNTTFIFSIHCLKYHKINKKLLDNLNIQYIKWAHSYAHNVRKDAQYLLAYPIHKTLYEKYPLKNISNNRNKILIFTKTNTKNKNLINKLSNQSKKIIKYFNNNNYECISVVYGSEMGGGFRRTELLESANNSCICLYLSFYDAGALSINEITFMGCYMIGFINNRTSQICNHSVSPISIIENETGEYIHDFARICDKNEEADSFLISGCKKVLNILKNRNLNHIEIAKKSREYYTEDRFIETIFT